MDEEGTSWHPGRRSRDPRRPDLGVETALGAGALPSVRYVRLRQDVIPADVSVFGEVVAVPHRMTPQPGAVSENLELGAVIKPLLRYVSWPRSANSASGRHRGQATAAVYSETFRSSALRPRSVQSPYAANNGLTTIHSPGR